TAQNVEPEGNRNDTHGKKRQGVAARVICIETPQHPASSRYAKQSEQGGGQAKGEDSWPYHPHHNGCCVEPEKFFTCVVWNEDRAVRVEGDVANDYTVRAFIIV